MVSALFSYIEKLQGGAGFGSVLDAGTGTHSIQWLISQQTASWTAVTGASAHARQVRQVLDGRERAGDRLLVGNWADPDLLAGECFDTVLADYLLGAVEGFSPYFQENLFARLRPLTRHRLYLTGVEPYVLFNPNTQAGELVWQLGRLRDACLLLTGEQPYREYPLDWVLEQLRRSGFRPIAARKFPIRYKSGFVEGQVNICLHRLEALNDRRLADALRQHADALRARVHAFIEAHGALPHGFDYVIAAEPV